jgi:tetratricopeptide (TPR) repeat protein
MASPEILAELGAAVEHHRSGRFAEAEAIYRKILADDPNHADAMQLLGALAGQTGREDLAIELIRRAIELSPLVAGYHSNLGKLLCDGGRYDEAVDACRRAVQLNPNLADAHNNLGNAFRGMKRPDAATAAYREALRIKPDHLDALKNLSGILWVTGNRDEAIEVYRRLSALKPDDAMAHNGLGNLLLRAERFDEAIPALRRAIELAPDLAAAHANLGQALCGRGELDESIAAYRRAIRLKPDFAQAHYGLGDALSKSGRGDEAIAACREAVRLGPEHAQSHNHLGAALFEAGRVDEAISECRRALELDADDAMALTNLGLGLSAVGKRTEAITAFRQAVAIDKDFAEAHYNLAVALLLKGEFEEGWHEYEHRWHFRDRPLRSRICSQPRWNGEALNGRTILLDSEQGFGDVIQFIRYVPQVVSRGGRVMFACSVELNRLLQRFPGVERIFSKNPPPPFDVHCPLMSLPRVLGTRLESIPADIPYLNADPQIAEAWHKKLEPRTDELRVGLAWAGKPTNKRDRDRSISLAQLGPLAAAAGITFYSLQKGDAALQAKHPPPGMQLIDLTADIGDFADTAGFISCLDLVVTVDTAVAHLAGAMGKPVWTLIPYLPDWRWLLDREDSPWYPTMRLFRQKTAGDWEEVVRRVAKAIETVR